MGSDNQLRINEAITSTNVRLIGMDGEQVGILTTQKALAMAEESELDLVEIAPEADPPVCRMLNYGKYLFERDKKRHEARKKQKLTQVKEVKFRPGTDVGDYQVKLRNITRFLSDGDKVKVTLRYRGREMAHQELGLKLLSRVEADLEEYGTVEQRPKMEGRLAVMVMAPKRNK